ncbi:MAG: hypothetical protein Q9217_005423 [Psora testacea]
MPHLQDLRVAINQTYFFVEIKGTATTAELVVGVLQPLKKIKMRGKDGRFDVRLGWWLTEEEKVLLGEVPFRVVEVGTAEPQRYFDFATVNVSNGL